AAWGLNSIGPVLLTPASPRRVRILVTSHRFVKTFDFAHQLTAAVADLRAGKRREVDAELYEKGCKCRLDCPRVPVLGLQRHPRPTAVGRTQETFRAALREPPGCELHQVKVGSVGAADEVRTRAHR